MPLDNPMAFDSKVKELDEALDTLDRLKKEARKLPLANPAAGPTPGTDHPSAVVTARFADLPIGAKVYFALVVAAGAGANIAMACDIVLAARSAKFIESFAATPFTAQITGKGMEVRRRISGL